MPTVDKKIQKINTKGHKCDQWEKKVRAIIFFIHITTLLMLTSLLHLLRMTSYWSTMIKDHAGTNWVIPEPPSSGIGHRSVPHEHIPLDCRSEVLKTSWPTQFTWNNAQSSKSQQGMIYVSILGRFYVFITRVACALLYSAGRFELFCYFIVSAIERECGWCK